MPGFLTDAQVTAAVLDQLQKTNATNTATLESWWPGVVTRANAWAYAEILGRLAARGYTQADVLAWDFGASFQTDLAVWKALSIAAAKQPGSYSARGVEYLDRRDELTGNRGKGVEAVFVVAGGKALDPGGTAGLPAAAALDTTRDLVVWPDPNDPDLGQVTRI